MRLSDDLIARLDRAAKKLERDRASLVRFLISTWLDRYESDEAAWKLNDEVWRGALEELDGRTRAYKASPTPGRISVVASYKEEQRRERRRAAAGRKPASVSGASSKPLSDGQDLVRRAGEIADKGKHESS